MAGLNANDQKGSGDFVEQPALDVAQYPARVVQIIDLGLQNQRAFQGQTKAPVDMIHMTYELSDEFMVDEEGEPREDKPRWYSEDFPFYSLEADKAKSTLRYNAIDPEGVTAGEFTELLTFPCQVFLTKEPKKVKGKLVKDKFTNFVGNVSGAIKVKGYEQPPLVNEPKVFLLADPDMEFFMKLPDWLQDRIKSNLNFNGSKLQELLGEEATEEEPVEIPTEVEKPAAPKTPAAPKASE